MSLAESLKKSVTKSFLGTGIALAVGVPALLFVGQAAAEMERMYDDAGGVPACDGVIEVRRGMFKGDMIDVHVCENGTVEMAKPHGNNSIKHKITIHPENGTYEEIKSYRTTESSGNVYTHGFIVNNEDAKLIADIAKSGTVRSAPVAPSPQMMP